MYKAIIFDFDGTIADSMVFMTQAYNRAAKIYGCDSITDNNIHQLRHMHARDVLQQLKIPYLKLPFVIFSTLGYFKTVIKDVKPFAHVPDLLKQLIKDNCTLYVISTNSPENIKLFLKQHDIAVFKEILSCGGYIFCKSEVIKKLLKREQIDPKTSIYVGDEVRDIEAAHQAGITSVAVSWGYNAPEKLKESRPDFLIENSQEFISLVTQSNRLC